MRGLVLLPVALLACAACARPARPAVMAEAEASGASAAARAAAALAPEAFARVEKLRRDAQTAYASGDAEGAAILAERSLAALKRAIALGRIAYAEDTANRAELARRDAEATLFQLEAEQRRVSADADDLELRIKAQRDAAIAASSPPSDPGREKARLSAARSAVLDAKLLCAAARMLGGDNLALPPARASLDGAEKDLAVESRGHPVLELAIRARADCLAALSAARRPEAEKSSTGRSDALLSELSAMGGASQEALSPTRDDRGVVVTLRGLFGREPLSSRGRQLVEALGRVARAHPEFPLEVVVHRAPGARAEPARDRARGESVAKALVEGGAAGERIVVEAAGASSPVIDPSWTDHPSRSERVEIIFVDPGG